MTAEHPIRDWKPSQQRLQDLGFYAGRIDGGRGPLTDQAIVIEDARITAMGPAASTPVPAGATVHAA